MRFDGRRDASGHTRRRRHWRHGDCYVGFGCAGYLLRIGRNWLHAINIYRSRDFWRRCDRMVKDTTMMQLAMLFMWLPTLTPWTSPTPPTVCPADETIYVMTTGLLAGNLYGNSGAGTGCTQLNSNPQSTGQ